MEQHSPFYEEWRECLRSHFFYVVKTRDDVTLPTLWKVLTRAGLTEDEVQAWYDEAARLRDGDDAES